MSLEQYFERFLEYKESQQIRRDRVRKENLRYLTKFVMVMMVLLVIVSFLESTP